MTVSECADAHRVLGKGSSKPGQWETEFVPFLREIMDSFAIDCVEEIWFVKPTQTGGTEAILNMVLYGALQDPGPAMVIEPTENLADEISQDRIDLMIESCDQLKEIKNPDPDDTTKKKKSFTSMTLYFAWSRSPSSLASRPIRYAFFDEVDKYEKFTGQEASPIALGKERTNTFVFTRKLVYVSTPTTEGNYITVGEKAADARFRYLVPCPHCGKQQQLIFDQVKWGKLKVVKEIEEIAWYECEECKGKIYNDQKSEMVRRGKWFDLISGLEFKDCVENERPKRIGFQISRLYSPWHTFGMVAGEFLRSKDYPEQLMNWKNSWMAEPWVEKYETKSEKEMLENMIDIEPLIVPEGTVGLTCGIDPSGDGFWFVILAWKSNLTVHLVHYGYLVGWEAVTSVVWENVYRLTGTETRLGIWRAALDTGGGEREYHDLTMTEEAYDWLRKHGKNKCFGTKGMSYPSMHKIKISKIDKMPKGQLITGGILLLNIDTGAFKDAIHHRLEVKAGDPGRLTFHKDVGADFISHLLSEEKRIDLKTGKSEWVKIRTRNHWLDAMVMAFAMADPEFYGGAMVLRGTERKKEEKDGEKMPPVNPVTQKPRGSWMKGW
jgi:phage terminase large subunit GpA-like protein